MCPVKGLCAQPFLYLFSERRVLDFELLEVDEVQPLRELILGPESRLDLTRKRPMTR